MCFRFGPCFGSGSGQDYGRSTSKATHHGGSGRQADHGYYSGVDHKSGPQAYLHEPAADETPRRNAYNDGGVRKYHFDDAGGHGGHASYVQDKADDKLKHPAAGIGRVGHVAGHTHTERLQEDTAAAAACRSEHAAAETRYYPTTITATISRY